MKYPPSIVTAILFVIFFSNCNKAQVIENKNTGLLSAKVLANGCGNDKAVVIQLSSPNRLAVNWKKPGTDSTFQNVLFTIDYKLSRVVGKAFSYSAIRSHTANDSIWVTTANCFDSAYYVFDGITIK